MSKVNHIGFSGNLRFEAHVSEIEVKASVIFNTEYFGDGDSKAYAAVENVYDGIHVVLKECVGYVQNGLVRYCAN